MKTLKYIVLAILLGINLVSCTVDDDLLENEVIETVETLETEELGSRGNNNGLDNDGG